MPWSMFRGRFSDFQKANRPTIFITKYNYKQKDTEPPGPH